MRILVFTTVFPNAKQPSLGVFVRERMFRVAGRCDLKVVAPFAWFPGASLLKKGFRPRPESREEQDGIEVLHPRFFSVPGIFKSLDALFCFLCSLLPLLRLKKRFPFQVIDAHFVYPDGVAAALLGKALGKPVVITVRESDLRGILKSPLHRIQIRWALNAARSVVTVCSDLKEVVTSLGVPAGKVQVVANGIDAVKFRAVDRGEARRELGLGAGRRIVVSVGWLIERKGFARLIEALPAVRELVPEILLVVIGGDPAAGGCGAELKAQVARLGLKDAVLFAGPKPHDELYRWLSAADLFCLATSGEGWANVFLEAMACGLPVVTSRVGGNAEVVAGDELGLLFDLDDPDQLVKALVAGLAREWDRGRIIGYAAGNAWEHRVQRLLALFGEITAQEEPDRLASKAL